MSNTESEPEIIHGSNTLGPLLLTPREVPLGGPRAMTVRRTLPQRERSLIGGWCFIDHYGPDRVDGSGGMQVPGHPHTGLQTVSWLFSGAVDHLDTVGSEATVRPGEVNLMTAGRGIAHSEFSTADTTILHGAQLWLALPESARMVTPSFENFRPATVSISPQVTALVFIGDLLGSSSPVTVYSPLVGAEITINGETTLDIPVDPEFEYGILIDSGDVTVTDSSQRFISATGGDLAALPPGNSIITLSTTGSARVLVLGGAPLNEEIVMWWNFIGRSHEDIVDYRTRWEQQRVTGVPDLVGPFPTEWDSTLPAPELPNGRLRSRS